ncbi:flagellar hook-associated protein FlgL [Sulfoacidibacillus thermotolerans]|uniref:Flagellar hook-associated protein 3 n=1 Tax=Sulfoacidibacillus thermotolerans TaxID=1765684 RepID=A0A2U3D7K1_SULT2|nr:flagellar hook-associated protein FlgL [Sulfoacidibacillus thermotolerans]PWI57276.1 flagellar hook-associated protein 3 [Sulfoacidibacillus thermotolerans]
MRITQNMMTNQFIYNITNEQQTMQTLENELSTGKTLTRPSDNPLAVSQDMSVRATLSQTAAYQSTINSGLSWMNDTSSAVQQILSTLQSLQGTVLEGINTTSKSPATLAALSQTAQELAANIGQTLDAKQGNRYLFGGVQIDTQVASVTQVPYSPTDMAVVNGTTTSTTGYYDLPETPGNPMVASITGSNTTLSTNQPYELQVAVSTSGTTTFTLSNPINQTVIASTQVASTPVAGSSVTLIGPASPSGSPSTYALTLSNSYAVAAGTTQSDLLIPSTHLTNPYSVASSASGTISYEVAPGVEIPVNVTAQQIMRTSPDGSSPSLQTTLQNIAVDLQTGNSSNLQSDLAALQENITNITNINADLGARIQRLNALKNQMSNYQTTLTSEKGVIEGANMAKVISQFNTDQTVFTAALKMGSEILLPSLVNFLPNG